MKINGKWINEDSISIDGIDTRDYPDFCDAFIEYCEFEDGTELKESELEELNDKGYSNGLIYGKTLEKLY